MMDRARAETVALLALAYLADDDHRLGRFMGWTGLDATTMRAVPGDGAVLIGALDYLLRHEALLLAFAEHAEIDAGDPARAYGVLAGPENFL